MECKFEIQGLKFWGSSKDREKREGIRKIACEKGVEKLANCKEFEIHIFAWVSKKRKIGDTDNLFKLVLDAFCKKQIEDDKSKSVTAGLYQDDTVRFIKHVSADIKDAEEDEEKTQIKIVGKA
jgi:hypothetical protein